WIAFGVCFWAIASLLQDAAFNLAGLAVCRLFIGVGEGLFGTGILYYLSLWYKGGEMGVRVFWFLGPTAIAGAFGGLITFAVGHIQSSVPNWKWLFLIEAVPTFLFGLFCLYWLPDRPTKNSRFKGKNAEIALARYYAEEYDKAEKIQKRHCLGVHGLEALRAGRRLPPHRMSVVLDLGLSTHHRLRYVICAGAIVGVADLTIGLGYSAATTANLMTVPPYVCAFVLMYSVSWLSDRYRTRGLPIAILMIVAGICYALLATLPSANLKGKYAFHQGPLGVSTANVLLLRAENKKRDRLRGVPEPGQAVDITELADRAPQFRYIL
ncbi:hypothetical protein EHS25_000967, partial [Saitozyma podzolica]